jgi:hypothetical protein
MSTGASCARGEAHSCRKRPWRVLHDAGMSFKKTLFATEQDRPDVARKRERWKAYQHRLDPARLVFIDETWAKTNMTRLRGWAPRGQKLLAKVPQGRWRTLTFLAALRCDRIAAPSSPLMLLVFPRQSEAAAGRPHIAAVQPSFPNRSGMSGVSRPAYEVALDFARPRPCAPLGAHGHLRLSAACPALRPLAKLPLADALMASASDPKPTSYAQRSRQQR